MTLSHPLLARLAPLVLLLVATAARSPELPEAVEAAVRALRRASDTEFPGLVSELVAAEKAAGITLRQQLADPKSRASALAVIGRADAKEAQRLREVLGDEPADALRTRELAAPYLERHLQKPVDDELERSFVRFERSFGKAARTLLRKFPAADPEEREQREELERSWNMAREAVLATVFDYRIYSDRDRGASGQPQVDRVVEALRAEHALLLEVVDAELMRFDRASSSSLEKQLRRVEWMQGLWRSAADKLRGRRGFSPEPLDEVTLATMRMLRALLLQDAGRPADAREALEGGDDFARSLLRIRRARMFEEYNDDYDVGKREQLSISEREIVRLVNEYRVALDADPLEIDGQLLEAARAHSSDMDEKAYFSHEAPDPERRTHRHRIAAAGYTNATVAETIYLGSGYEDAAVVFDGWYRSSSHHRVLISPRYRQIGLGRARSYYTANLGGGWKLPRRESREEALDAASR